MANETSWTHNCNGECHQLDASVSCDSWHMELFLTGAVVCVTGVPKGAVCATHVSLFFSAFF